MAKKKTHEQFVEEMRIKHPNIEVLGKYINSRTKIICVCLIDCEIWEAVPYELLKYGCPVCSGSRKNHYSFIKELNKKNPNNIRVLGRYKGIHKNIKCKCEVCGHIWNTAPNELLQGGGCPQCAINRRKKTDEQFKQEMKIKNPNIKILGKYIDSYTNIECECKIDGHKWTPRPNDLSNGTGCPICAIENSKNPNLTDEERKKKRSIEGYHQWVKSVYERDNYTCQCCGQYSGKLNVHHKDGYNWCKERRLDVSNGVTVCEECHKEFHKIYGYGNNTEEQFEEFINNKDIIEFINNKKITTTTIKYICTTTNKTFYTTKEAMNFYKIKSNHITECCKGERNYCGKLEDGTPLVWVYYDEY